MVGDWPERDIEGGKALEMKTCLVKNGQEIIRKGVQDKRIKNIIKI